MGNDSGYESEDDARNRAPDFCSIPYLREVEQASKNIKKWNEYQQKKEKQAWKVEMEKNPNKEPKEFKPKFKPLHCWDATTVSLRIPIAVLEVNRNPCPCPNRWHPVFVIKEVDVVKKRKRN